MTTRKYQYPLYTMDYVGAVTGTSQVVDLGMPVIPGMVIDSVRVKFPALASGTITVGDDDDADRFIASTSTTAAGTVVDTKDITLSDGEIATGAGFKYTEANVADTVKLMAFCAGATWSGQVIRVTVHYYFDPFH